MLKSIAFVAAAALAVPAMAQQPAPASTNSEDKAKDPNRKICERVEKIGSRVNFITVCMTAREWKDLRDNHRQHTESVQRIVNQEPIN
jgi:hypothetical protein